MTSESTAIELGQPKSVETTYHYVIVDGPVVSEDDYVVSRNRESRSLKVTDFYVSVDEDGEVSFTLMADKLLKNGNKDPRTSGKFRVYNEEVEAQYEAAWRASQASK